MSPSDPLKTLARALADAGPSARLYLQPVGIVGGSAAEALVAAGQAMRLAGGPLAATGGLVHVRAGGMRRCVPMPVAALHEVAADGTSAGQRLSELVARCAAARSVAADGPRIMGVVNVTPDSFSDGGVHLDPAAAIAHCRSLAAAGADILDIGGESTRPGAAPVLPAEEAARVGPVLEGLRALRADLPGTAISIDTRHADVMRLGLALGVDIINDVTALAGDPASLDVAARSTARVVLMHMQGTPETMNIAPRYDDVVLDVFDFLEARVAACVAAGIALSRIVVDPGIGFGKRGKENQEILRGLSLFHGLGCPILLGLSRKGLGVSAASMTPREREPVSLAAAQYALSQGVQILRVHDVAATRQVVAFWRRLSG